MKNLRFYQLYIYLIRHLNVRTLLQKILFCLILCTVPQFLYSQVNSTDHFKYWHYRQKLISDFLVMGVEDPIIPTFSKDEVNRKYGGCGLSLPAGNRYDTDGHYNWGDATSSLGFYIGVLATELRLLYDNGQDWSSTQYELYCALKAYERLDKTCAAIAYPFSNFTRDNPLNGSFIRDDVDISLFDNKAFAAKLKTNQTWNSDLEKGQSNTHFLGYPWGNNVYMSQDQMAYLFMGFALVKRCLNDVPALKNYNGTDLVADLAQTYTRAIADLFLKNDWYGKLDTGVGYDKWDGLRSGCAFPFAWSATHITGDSKYVDAFCNWTCVDNAHIEQLFKAYPDDIFGINGAGDFSHLWEIKNDFAIALAICYAAVGQTAWASNIGGSIDDQSSKYDMDLFALLYHCIYSPAVTDNLKTKLLSYIKSAPFQGPMYYPTPTNVSSRDLSGVPEWRGTNRFCRPLKKNGTSTSHGEFNGLDFMLLYNMFWLINPGPDYIQTSYEYGHILDTNNDINKSGTVYRDAPIFLASKIMPDPNNGSSTVFMKSTYEIDLLPGFQTGNNTDLTLKVAPIGKVDGSNFTTSTISDLGGGYDFEITGELTPCAATTSSVWVYPACPYSGVVYSWSARGEHVGYGTIGNFPILPGNSYDITCSVYINGTLIKTHHATLVDQDLSQCDPTKKSADTNEPETQCDQTILYQNFPNPFNQTTEIKYFIPVNASKASIFIFNMKGSLEKTINIADRGNGTLTINSYELQSGMYLYSLIVDGKEIDTKQMVLTK